MTKGLKSWQDAVIYFILIDRFYNGDRTNDDFRKGEFDPRSDDCFHGGDLKGIRLKLPFIKAMGYDAIWITPPVHNQWINPYITTRGFHGYWAYDFTAVDPHFGTLEDYKALVEDAHRLGIKVIQDIVVNHTGNYFTVDAKGYDPERPEKTWKPSGATAYPPEGEPKAPNDPVFRMNDPRDPEHKAAGVYNFTPNISDFKSREQTLTWSMGDLDDVNLKSPAAIARMKEIYRYWMDQVGIDGFRVDTVFYTPEEFYERFLYDDDGIKRHAERRGLDDFLVFGEVWSYDYKAINRYLEGPKVKRLDSAIDLPLNEALTQVFFRKAPTERLRAPLRARRPNRNLWVNFLDNHDVERIYSRGSWPSVQQSLVALFTLPGIPCVTWGTEAGFTLSRQDMFKDDCFDEGSRPAAFLRRLISFRKEHPAFSRGACRLEATSHGPGLLSWSVSWKGERYLVLFNTSPDAAFCPLEGRWEALLSESAAAGRRRSELESSLVLKGDSFLVLRRTAAPARAAAAEEVSLTLPRKRSYKGKLTLGLAVRRPGQVKELALLDNSNYGRRLKVKERGAKSLTLDTTRLGNGRHRLWLLAKTAGGHALSKPVEVFVRNPYRLVTRAEVPAKDKSGLGAKVMAPGDPSYNGQLSMEEVSIYTSGRDLRLKVRMERVTNEWNPPLGFDHVYFSVFFDFPGQPGRRYFPKMNMSRPDFEFNAGFLLYGWGTRTFGAADSTPEDYGVPLIGEVTSEADVPEREVTFTFSKSFFEGVKSFAGVKVWVSTWDGYLGEFRAIAERKEDWNFYILNGGPAAALPKVFDHAVITL